MKFVASYSGGKDSVLALYRAIKAGHEPVALLTTCDKENECSWFHSIPRELLYQTAYSLNIPLAVLNTKGDRYAADFESELLRLKALGAEMCIFGDIDIKEHYDWCNDRCENAGMRSCFPLWNENRKSLAIEFVDLGFEAVITVINTAMMNEEYLGKTLTRDIIEQLELAGTDVCGENGEYHTFVTGGCIFKKPILFELGEIVRTERNVRLPILYKGSV